MTANLTQYAQKKLVDHSLGLASYTAPTTWLALFTADPGETGLITNEVSGGSYARVSLGHISPDQSKMGQAVLATGIASNTTTITFATPSGSWGLVSHAGIADGPATSPDANLLFYFPLTTALQIGSGGFPVTFNIGALNIFSLFSDPSQATQYLAKKWVDHILGTSPFTMPTTVYLGLFSSDPTETGSLVGEISTGGYTRQAITSKMDAAILSTGAASNNADIQFPDPTADYSVTHYGILDASTSGNMLWRKARTTTLSVRSGRAAVKVSPGQLTVAGL